MAISTTSLNEQSFQAARHQSDGDPRTEDICAPTLPTLPLRMRRPRHPQSPMSCLIFDPRTSRNLGEVGRNLAKVSDDKTPQSEHWRGFQAFSWVGLLIRRSLVRAQAQSERRTPGWKPTCFCADTVWMTHPTGVGSSADQQVFSGRIASKRTTATPSRACASAPSRCSGI
jgi:hypothetical protein